MLGYRLYFLNDAGRIEHAAEALYESDKEAIAWAEGQPEGRDLELWTGARVVAQICKRHDAQAEP
jgi:hypothetical protein